MKIFTASYCILLSLFVLSTPLEAAESSDQEIQLLIQAVGTSGCDFIRNGKRHDSQAAVEHMQLKYKRGKRYATTAENFIDRLASKSSFSGKPYLIVCQDSGEHTASDWLHAALRVQRAKNL